MFNKKPRRNFRQRKESSSDDENEKKDSGNVEDNEKAAAVVNKPSKQAQNRGISCSSKPDTTPPRTDNTDGGDEETKDYRTDGKKDKHGIKKKTDTTLSFSDDKEAEEPTFKVKKCSDKAVLFQVKKKKEASPDKNTQPSVPASGHVPPSASPGLDSDRDSVASPCSPQPDDDDEDDDDEDRDSDGVSSMSSFASSASESSRSTANPVIFPSAKQIEAARKQRHAKRAQKEFIRLGRDGHSSAGSTPDHYSREDEDEDGRGDDDDETDDHERRIEFAPRLKSIRERITEKLGDSDCSLSGTDGEEQELWEETQIGKGVKRRPGEQSPSGSESSSYSSSSRRGRRNRKRRPIGVPKTLPSISVSMIKKRITGTLDSLKEVHRARQAQLRRMEGDVDGAKTSLETLEEKSSESQLKFYRTMNLYVHNLVECLREKVVVINSLELELHVLLSDQMEALTAQRRQRIKEQADRLQQLSYNKDELSDGSTSGTQTQSKDDSDIQDEEFSNIPEDTKPSAEEEEQLQKKKADIMSKSQAVFSDVQDEFSDVKKILSRFEEWRGCYSDSYHSAYISLCLPKLLNPIIRHQLLAFNPLMYDGVDFEDLPWFTAVETFCHGHGHEELEHTDRQTLSNIIEKTVLPKITALVELVWDPMSSHQSACLSEFCVRLKEDFSIFEGEQTKPVKAFIEAVVHRLTSCVDEDIFIPLYPKKLLEDHSSPQRHFRDQQFLTAIKLLGNMGKWDLLLPESVLKELVLDKLLSRYLMITLNSQTLDYNAVHACKMIADSLPLSWHKGRDVCLPQLENFKNHLVQKVHTMCKRHPPEGQNTRSAVLKVLQILSTIRCNDSIMAIAERYRYGDLIYSHQLLNQEAV